MFQMAAQPERDRAASAASAGSGASARSAAVVPEPWEWAARHPLAASLERWAPTGAARPTPTAPARRRPSERRQRSRAPAGLPFRTCVLGICLSPVDLEYGRADSGGGGGLPAHASAAGGVVLHRGGLPGVPGAVALAGRIRVPGLWW